MGGVARWLQTFQPALVRRRCGCVDACRCLGVARCKCVGSVDVVPVRRRCGCGSVYSSWEWLCETE
eukprot:308947-Chlamydomonas_euryale.AAC.2